MNYDDDIDELNRLSKMVPGTSIVLDKEGNSVVKNLEDSRNVCKFKDSKFGLWFGDTDFLSLDASFDEAVAFLSRDISLVLKDLENTKVY